MSKIYNNQPPYPPAHLMDRVAGSSDKSWFDESGKRSVCEWERVLSLLGKEISDYGTIVDFGCGCGRTLRHLNQIAGDGHVLIGLDPDSEAISWINGNLPGVRAYAVNDMPPVNELEAGCADLILNHSVFTHLPEDVQFAWLDELARICKPGAVVSLSFHGSKALDIYLESISYAAELTKQVKTIMEWYGFYWAEGRRESENALPDYYGNAYHSCEYILKNWTGNFKIIAWVKEAALDLQDIVLLKRLDAPVKQHEKRDGYKDDYAADGIALLKQNDIVAQYLNEIIQCNKNLNKRIDEIYSSKSWKIGHFLVRMAKPFTRGMRRKG